MDAEGLVLESAGLSSGSLSSFGRNDVLAAGGLLRSRNLFRARKPFSDRGFFEAGNSRTSYVALSASSPRFSTTRNEGCFASRRHTVSRQDGVSPDSTRWDAVNVSEGAINGLRAFEDSRWPFAGFWLISSREGTRLRSLRVRKCEFRGEKEETFRFYDRLRPSDWRPIWERKRMCA